MQVCDYKYTTESEKKVVQGLEDKPVLLLYIYTSYLLSIYKEPPKSLYLQSLTRKTEHCILQVGCYERSFAIVQESMQPASSTASLLEEENSSTSAKTSVDLDIFFLLFPPPGLYWIQDAELHLGWWILNWAEEFLLSFQCFAWNKWLQTFFKESINILP